MDGKTVWLTQAAMAELYQTSPQNITLHIKSIYDDAELEESATCKDYLQVREEGSREVRRSLKHYSLDVILAVGYRVRSQRGTQFRQWATTRLKELLIKGFTLDDERIKAGRTIGQDYFDELLERVRDIRASERLFYQKITDIYATSVDYDAKAEISQQFFAHVQNKLHWAIHGHTAAEVIKLRADAVKPNMGLTTWKNGPTGPIRKADTEVAKNYLKESELRELNRIVGMYLDYAEDQAKRGKVMHMADWAAKLDAFLQFNERNILTHAGRISHELALNHAHAEFIKFDDERRRREAIENLSDFDKSVKKLEQKPEPKPRKRSKGGEG
ncbi:MAG: virulence RhuM family protein [Planctomycetes bacterium]|nr:virulence RhuM family protein [Planctomycetota bacterium]